MNEEPIKTEFVVEIKISDKNLSYRSDFSEAETIFWLESVKGLMIKNTFEDEGDTRDSELSAKHQAEDERRGKSDRDNGELLPSQQNK